MKSLFWALSILASFAIIPLESKASTGTVILARGVVTATDGNSVDRVLSKGAAIEEGDVIKTAIKSFAVIRMLDNTKLTLKPGTVLAIGKFSLEEGKEEACINLVKGGLRTVTGLIGKRKPDSFQVDTPIASIGIRGTDFITRICAGDECLVDEPEAPIGEFGDDIEKAKADVAEAINESLPEGMYGSCETGAIVMSQCAGQAEGFEMGKCRISQRKDCTVVGLSPGQAGYTGVQVVDASGSVDEGEKRKEGDDSDSESDSSDDSSSESNQAGGAASGSVAQKSSSEQSDSKQATGQDGSSTESGSQESTEQGGDSTESGSQEIAGQSGDSTQDGSQEIAGQSGDSTQGGSQETAGQGGDSTQGVSQAIAGQGGDSTQGGSQETAGQSGDSTQGGSQEIAGQGGDSTQSGSQEIVGQGDSSTQGGSQENAGQGGDSTQSGSQEIVGQGDSSTQSGSQNGVNQGGLAQRTNSQQAASTGDRQGASESTAVDGSGTGVVESRSGPVSEGSPPVVLTRSPNILTNDPYFQLSDLSDQELNQMDVFPDSLGSSGQCTI